MTTLTELSLLLREGENSGVEFKRDDITPQDLARAMVGFSNLRGGRVLLGVEDDGRVSGLTRDDVEEWVLTVARDKVRPPLNPYVERLTDPVSGNRLLVITVEPGYAVHAVWHHNHFSYFIRVGRQTREASPEELARLQQQRGTLRAELQPVTGVSYDQLDHRRLDDYFTRVRGQGIPERDDREARTTFLIATEFMAEGVERPVATVAGVALFGRAPSQALPQSKIDAVAYPGDEKDYATLERTTLRGPLLPLMSATGEVLELGLVDAAVAFVRRNVGASAALVDGVRRLETPGLPEEAVREALVNAVIHRDYLLTNTDIELSIYSDRLEAVSPGRLPNGVTIEGMKLGVRTARNELFKDVMRDYGYLEHMGLGIPRKIVAGMLAFNGTTPDLELGPENLTVRLWRSPDRAR